LNLPIDSTSWFIRTGVGGISSVFPFGLFGSSLPGSFLFGSSFLDLFFIGDSSSSGLTGSNPNKMVGFGGSSPITPILIADCVAVSLVLSIWFKVAGSFVPAGSKV